MSEKGDKEFLAVLDLHALVEIATNESDNFRKVALDKMADGDLAVPARVWQQFQDMYDKEYDYIKEYIVNKPPANHRQSVAAAELAEKQKTKLSWGPYDNASDIYAAAASWISSTTLLTTSDGWESYDGLDELDVRDLYEWIES